MISRDLSYHGMTLATLSMGGIRKHQKEFQPLLWNNPHIKACFCYHCPFGKSYPDCGIECAVALERKIIEEGKETVSAFIAEPVVGTAAGAVVPPQEYFPLIREICDKYGILFIADEVVTGFGRTGKNMGMEHFGVVPDITVFAKGVSSGYAPLAGMAVSEKITAIFAARSAEFRHLYSFSANPLSCAIGNEVLRIIEDEKLVDRVNKSGSYLSGKLERFKKYPIIGDIRGTGLLWSVEFVRDKNTKEAFPAELQLKMKIIMSCLMRGVFFYPGYYEDEQGRGDHIMITPPFIITEEQIDFSLTVLETVINEIMGQMNG